MRSRARFKTVVKEEAGCLQLVCRAGGQNQDILVAVGAA